MSSLEDDHLPPLPPAPALHSRSLSTQSIPSSASSSPSSSPHHSPARRPPGSPPLSRSSSTNSSPRSPLSPRRSAPDSPSSLSRSSSSRSPPFTRSPELARRSTLASAPAAPSSSGSSGTPSLSRHIRSSSLLAKVSPSLGASTRFNGSVASIGLRSPGFPPGIRAASIDRQRERELLREDERRRTQGGGDGPLGLGIGGFAKGLGNLPSPPTTASDGGSHGKADGVAVRARTTSEFEGGSPVRPERPPRNEARTTPTSRRTASTSSEFEIPIIAHQSPTLTYSSPHRPALDERRSSSLVSSSLVVQAELTNAASQPRQRTSEGAASPPGSRRNSGAASSALQRTSSVTSSRRHSQIHAALSFSPAQERVGSPSSAARSPTSTNPSPLQSPSLRNSIGSLPDRPTSAAGGSDSGASYSRRADSAASQRTLPARDLGTSDEPADDSAEARRQRRSSKMTAMREKSQHILDRINSQVSSSSIQSPGSQHSLSPVTPNFASPSMRHSDMASPLSARQETDSPSGRSTPRRSEILQRTLRSARSTLDDFGTPSSTGSVSRRSSTMGLLLSAERDRERDGERERRVRTLGERGSGGRRSEMSEEWTGSQLGGRTRTNSIEGPARSFTSMGDYPVSPEYARRREAHSEIIRPVSSFSSTTLRDEQLAGHLRRIGSREGLLTSPRAGRSRRAGSDAFLLDRRDGGDDLPDSPALAGATRSPEVRNYRPGLPREFLDRAERRAEQVTYSPAELSPRTAVGTERFADSQNTRLASPRINSPRGASPLRFPTAGGERARKLSSDTARSGASASEGEDRRANGSAYTLPSPRATRGVGSGGSSVSSGARSAYRSGRQDSISEVNEDGSPTVRTPSRLAGQAGLDGGGADSGDLRDRTLKAVHMLIAAGELQPSDLTLAQPPPPSRSAPPGHYPGHVHVSPRKPDSVSGRASVLDHTSPRVRRLSLIEGGSQAAAAVALARSGSAASRASGAFGLGSSSAGQLDHQRHLDQAFDYFAAHFGASDPGREVVSPESVELVQRMAVMLASAGRLNAGLRALAGQAQDAQVRVEVGERGQGGEGAELAQFGRALSGLVRASDDQQRGLTEALMAFVRVERERDRLRREGEQFARPASRASFSTMRGSPAGPLHPSPKRGQAASPFEGGHGFTRGGPSRQQLRDPLLDLDEDGPRRAQTMSIGAGVGRSPYVGGGGGVDSPTPMSRRGEGQAQERLPLVGAGRRQSSEAGGVDRLGLPLSAARSTATLRTGKSSADSQTTARPATSSANSIRFPKSGASRATVDFGSADSHVSPTKDLDPTIDRGQEEEDEHAQRPRAASAASVASSAARAAFARTRTARSSPSTDDDEFHIAPQGLSSPEFEQRAPSPVAAGRLAGVRESLKNMVRRKGTADEGVPDAVLAAGAGLGLERTRSNASPEEVRSEARRARDEIMGRVLGR